MTTILVAQDEIRHDIDLQTLGVRGGQPPHDKKEHRGKVRLRKTRRPRERTPWGTRRPRERAFSLVDVFFHGLLDFLGRLDAFNQVADG